MESRKTGKYNKPEIEQDPSLPTLHSSVLRQAPAAPHMIMLSLQSRARALAQYNRIKRAMLDACQHPLCTEYQRRILKQMLQEPQFREWTTKTIMVTDHEWPIFSLALRKFDPVMGHKYTEYQQVIKGRERYQRFLKGGYAYARRDF